MKWLLSYLDPKSGARVLDVGGYPYTWRDLPVALNVTTLNLEKVPDEPCARTMVGNGCKMDFPASSFDILFSNSVIEHVGSADKQKEFAAECRRVGRSLWVQTPARSFFMEPHLITPFIHFASLRWQRRLLRNFTTWGLLSRPSRSEVDDFLAEVRLLNRREMEELFPDCTIVTERFLGMPKSYIAIRTC